MCMMAVLLPQDPRAQKLESVMLGGFSKKSGHVEMVVLVVVVFIVLYVFDACEIGWICGKYVRW